MDEQVEIISKKHRLMLDLATIAKYLAWLMLIFYIFRVALYIPTYQVRLLGAQALFDPVGLRELVSYLGKNPYYLVTLISAMLNLFLTGVII